MLTLQYAKEPVFADETGNCISLLVKWAEFDEEHPFCATNYDDHEHGRNIYERAIANEFGIVAPYVSL